MTTPELTELLRKLAETQAALFAQVRALSDAEQRRHPNGTEWSPKQQLAHLAAGERLWAGWARQVCARPESDVGPVPSEGHWAALHRDADERPLEDLLAGIETARADTLAWARNLTPEQLARRGRHVEFGELTVLQMLRALYRHQRMHMDQIAGRAPEFAPRQG